MKVEQKIFTVDTECETIDKVMEVTIPNNYLPKGWFVTQMLHVRDRLIIVLEREVP